MAMRRKRSACSVAVSTIRCFSVAITALRMVRAGSVTTIWPLAAVTQSASTMVVAMNRRRCSDMPAPFPLRLPPCTEIVRGTADQTPASGFATAHAQQLHVHRCHFGITGSFTTGQELFQRMREQLIRGHILTPREQFAGSHFVQNRSHFMIARRGVEHIVFERLRSLLQVAVVAAHERDLMTANLGDRIRQLDRGVAVFDRLSGGRWKTVQKAAWLLEDTRCLSV